MFWALIIGIIGGACTLCTIQFFEERIHSEDPYADARSITIEEDVLG